MEAGIGAQRRRFLRGMPRGSEAIRPPWLLAPAAFTEQCTRCGHCREQCPEGIVVHGDGGFPEIDFKLGECTFCAECTTACEAELFLHAPHSIAQAWPHRATVSEQCLASRGITCRSCEDACEPRAIRFPLVVGGPTPPQIDPLACNGCGACVAPCPENAIAIT